MPPAFAAVQAEFRRRLALLAERRRARPMPQEVGPVWPTRAEAEQYARREQEWFPGVRAIIRLGYGGEPVGWEVIFYRP